MHLIKETLCAGQYNTQVYLFPANASLPNIQGPAYLMDYGRGKAIVAASWCELSGPKPAPHSYKLCFTAVSRSFSKDAQACLKSADEAGDLLEDGS